jgi:ABC-type transport system substrate-binding protein
MASCSSSKPKSSGSGSPTGQSGGSGTPAVKTSGILRINAGLSTQTGGTITFDPTQALAQATNVPWELAVYDSLLHRSAQTGAFEPGLATSATVSNPTTVTIALRPGVKFSDGTTFDASAVQAGLLRNKNAPQHGQFDSSLQKIASIDITDPLHLTVHLSAPVAGRFYDNLTLPSTYIVSPGAAQQEGNGLATHPVGAGPFELSSFVPDQAINLVKNPTYWDASSIRLAGIDFVNVTPGPQEVNALEAGTDNLTSLTSFSSPQVLQGQFNVQEVKSSHTPTYVEMCRTNAPYNNLLVRQALNYATNSALIIQSIQHGIGALPGGIFTEGTPYYDASLASLYPYNPSKAKQLLSQAGYSNGLSIPIIVLPGTALQQIYQVLQQEWGAVGVKLSLVPSQNQTIDLYIRHAAPTALLTGFAVGDYGGLNSFVPGTIADLCSYSDPALDALAQQASAVSPESSQGIALFRQIQTKIFQDALDVFIASNPTPFAWSKKVQDVTINPYYGIGPVVDYWSGIYISS